nr:50S ribosomal protein L29 [Candidatus Levybacteria bacterium]
MKLRDKKQLFEKSEKELIKDLKQAKEALFNLILEKSQNKLKNTKSLFWKRKEIAWILTILKEKELLTKKENI